MGSNGKCNDIIVKSLNDMKYNPILEPAEDICPLLLLSWDKKNFERLGPLSDIVKNEIPKTIIDHISKNIKVVDIKINKTGKLDISGGLGFFGNFLSALGIKRASLSAAYGQAAAIELRFENVLKNSIDLTKIGDYLTNTTLKLKSPIIENLDADGKSYLIVEILKSNSLKIVAYDAGNASMGINIDHIEAEGKVNIGRAGAGTSEVSYEGDKYLSVAFKAAPFWVDRETGGVHLKPPKVVGAFAFKTGETSLNNPEELTPVVFAPGTLLTLKQKKT